MHQFQVPQFITVEDKVIGPFTIKQFLYLGGGGLLIVGIYMFFELFIVILVGIPIAAFAAALAFLKINEQPFPTIVKNAVFYFLKPRLYLWRQEQKKVKKTALPTRQEEPRVKNIPTVSESKLADLAWSLDIKEKH